MLLFLQLGLVSFLAQKLLHTGVLSLYERSQIAYSGVKIVSLGLTVALVFPLNQTSDP